MWLETINSHNCRPHQLRKVVAGLQTCRLVGWLSNAGCHSGIIITRKLEKVSHSRHYDLESANKAEGWIIVASAWYARYTVGSSGSQWYCLYALTTHISPSFPQRHSKSKSAHRSSPRLRDLDILLGCIQSERRRIPPRSNDWISWVNRQVFGPNLEGVGRRARCKVLTVINGFSREHQRSQLRQWKCPRHHNNRGEWLERHHMSITPLCHERLYFEWSADTRGNHIAKGRENRSWTCLYSMLGCYEWDYSQEQDDRVLKDNLPASSRHVCCASDRIWLSVLISKRPR